MLKDVDVIATIAVKDLDAAREFYEDKLGLKRDVEEEPGSLAFRSGRTSLFVYESEYAGTNEATAATWTVDELEPLVASLKKKGIEFEHYDLPGMEREGDIHTGGTTKAAWFKDPDGNVLAVVSSV
jgi:catechol 2,3-dioxygenase-like lactoylglutathione lyase family enzyme